ncbi:MAG: DNA repair protein RecN [Bacteroidota bacterium]|nr:DNA repair protein RecN [Bacteroidota bacterium]MDX5504630.1 DNA repair protein RecN [Bacteroidota bacterium]
MIKELLVQNFALIDHLELPLAPGFTTLTGETGAGKSILLGAMQLALGKRADLGQLKDPDKKSVIELTVVLDDSFRSFFDDNELDYYQETLLRREILPGGKSRAFINDTPVRLDQLRSLSERLIDIHSQHDTLLLTDESYQLFLLDEFAGIDGEKKLYQGRFREFRRIEKELFDLQKVDGESSDIEYLRFLHDELEPLKLEIGEEEELEDELRRLGHVEDVREGVSVATQLLETDETGVLPMMRNILQSLEMAARFDHRFEELLERARSAEIEWVDISRELQSLSSDLEGDPQRLRFVETRLGLIQNLKAKHRVSTGDELVEKFSELKEKLNTLEGREERVNELEKQRDLARSTLAKAADELHKAREKAIPDFVNEVERLLKELSMPEARFSILLEPSEVYSSEGNDQIKWQFSANKGMRPLPIQKVASGGELSRVMLSLKAILSRSRRLPTIIFDEIDTGVSGQAAGKIARILKEMGQNMQVLAITHLPQIASAGEHHIQVYKTDSKNGSETRIRPLDEESRVEEVARLLSGEKLSDAALANARDLLDLSH